MFLLRKTSFTLFLISFIGNSYCQTILPCNTVTTFDKAGYTATIKFPPTNSLTCEFVLKSSPDTYFTVEMSYSFYIRSDGYCTNDQLIIVSPDGDVNYRNQAVYCGTPASPVTFKTVGNELRIYIKTNDVRRTANIKIQNWAVTTSNCDCSWTYVKNIANGENESKI